MGENKIIREKKMSRKSRTIGGLQGELGKGRCGLGPEGQGGLGSGVSRLVFQERDTTTWLRHLGPMLGSVPRQAG